MKIVFVDTPPFLEWQPDSRYTKGGRRFPSLSVTGEKTYNYLVLQTISVLRERQNYPGIHLIDAQVEGLAVEPLLDRLAALKPDILVFYSEQIKSNVDMHVALKIKERTDTLVVFTGPLVTAMDLEFMNSCPAIDCVCRGEFDYMIGEIAACREGGKSLSSVEGITWRNNGVPERSGEKRHVEDLDALPFPAYDAIDFNNYRESVFVALPTATMITSRGCPFRCIYCWFPQTIYSHKWRSQSPERVVNEMEHLVRKFGVREIRIDDDMFEVDKKRVLAICRLMAERKLNVPFAPQCRPDYLDSETVTALKQAGCDRVLLGIESGNQDVLDKMKKDMKLQEIRDAVRLLKKHGIDIHNCFTMGFPWDTKETIRQTIDFACELNSEFCQFSIATPLPGTEYYSYVREQGYLATQDLSQYDGFCNAVVKYPHLSREEISALELEAYRRYFLRPAYVFMMFRRMFRSPAHFLQTLRFARAFWKRRTAGWI